MDVYEFIDVYFLDIYS